MTTGTWEEWTKRIPAMTFGGIPARFVTIDGESYIAVKQSDVDAVTMKVMTSMTREISK